MITHIAWLPADEAPTMVPLLCYWAPFPEAEDVEDRPEFWGIAVRQKRSGIDRWYMYCPTWEGGLGNPYQGAPDFFAPLGRPDGNHKWSYGYRDAENGDYEPVAHLLEGNSTESMQEADTDPQRIAASKAKMPRLGAERPTVPLKVDGCGSGWRTIDTAPKDGTEVDLFHPDYGRITGSHWDRDLDSWIILPADSFPTHWMPVPEAP